LMNRMVDGRASPEPARSEVEGSSLVLGGQGRPALHSELRLPTTARPRQPRCGCALDQPRLPS
jgi:hypothetical protein